MTTATLPSTSTSRTLAVIVIGDSIEDYDRVVERLSEAFGSVHSVRVEDRQGLVHALDKGGWSAVLADHDVSRISSQEALRTTRRHTPNLPFVIVSATPDTDPAVAAIIAGVDGLVSKAQPGRLASSLAQAIEAVRSRTRRDEAEAALVESEARFRSLASNLPGMVFQIEADAGRLTPVYAGEGARRLFGMTAEDMASDAGAWLSRLGAAEVEALRTHFRIATAGVTSFHWDETLTSAAPVAPHWIEQVIEVPADEQAGLPLRHIEFKARARRVGETRVLWDGIATDITRQKEAEQELTRSREELRELALNLAKVRENERAAIARELHDDVGSTLTGVKFQLQWLKGHVGDDVALRNKLVQLGELVDSAITASSRIMHDLRPAILDQGIVAALEWQAHTFEQRTGIACHFIASADEIPLAPAQAMVVFRVCQEALNNVVKHAGAGAVEITLTAADDGVALDIRDDGRGITVEDIARRGRLGLRGMHERALAIGGVVRVGLRDDRSGTSVRLSLPGEAFAGPGDALERSAQ